MAIDKIIKAKPCPCCGEKRDEFYDKRAKRFLGLSVGVQSSCHYGVHCYSCGLSLSISIPDKSKKTWKEIEADTTNAAVKLWNRRQG